MEYINGQSLQDKLNRHGHLELKEILRIGQQIAAGWPPPMVSTNGRYTSSGKVWL
jgi:hypothetical protein